jgi:serine/threonine protein kinase
MTLQKGQVLRTPFETYTVGVLKGAGGSGEVYEAHDSDGKAWAVKILDPARTSSLRLRRFKNEIHFCTKNTHKNILQVQATGITDAGATFYVMPLYAGTLRDLMKKGVAPENVLPYFGQITDGVEAAHLQNVWHRDIKPENILFSESTLIVADFGIAHFEDEELLTAVETKNQERLANFLYSAPEQKIRGQKVDSKADVYALGLILNEMFSGTTPLGTGFRRVGDVVLQFGYVDSIVDLMLRQDPAARPTIQDMKRELIARGNEFLSVQRLSSLKSEVVPENEVDDPVIANPLRIEAADYQNDQLIITLSAAPPPNWIMAFQNPRSQWSAYQGCGPENFTFQGNKGRVPLRGIQANPVLQNAKEYVQLANRQYAERVISEHRKDLEIKRQQLRERIQEEERRRKILGELKL